MGETLAVTYTTSQNYHTLLQAAAENVFFFIGASPAKSLNPVTQRTTEVVKHLTELENNDVFLCHFVWMICLGFVILKCVLIDRTDTKKRR